MFCKAIFLLSRLVENESSLVKSGGAETVYISLEKAQGQSLEYDVPLTEEVVRLVTHGLLHLTGRVDDSEETYNAMVEDTEKYIEHYFTKGVSG